MKLCKATLIAAALLMGAACGRLDPKAEFASAKSDFESGKLQAATVRLSNVIRSDPNNAEAHLLRARITLELGDYRTALEEVERARSLGSKDETAILYAEAAVRLGETDKAVAALSAAQPALEGDTQYWISRAEVEVLANLPVRATESLASAARLGADSASYSRVRGQLAVALHDETQAEALFTAAIAGDPRDADARTALGQLYARSGRAEEALKQFSAAADLFHANGRAEPEARALLDAIQIHLVRNDLDAASGVADRLARAIPRAPMAAYVRGLVDYRSGRFDTAAESLQNAINAAPDNAQFLTLLAATQLAQGNLGQAEQQLIRVLAANPREPAAIKLLAETRLRQQRPDAALDALRPLAGSGAEDAQVGLLTGLANVRSGNTEQGVLYLEQAEALDPTNQLLKLELAKAYATLGRFAEASNLLNSGVDQPGSALASRLLRLLSFARAGDAEGGNQDVAALLKEQPNDPQAYIVAAFYRQAINAPQEARELLETAVRLDGKLVQARMLLAGALAQEGRSADAEKELRRVIDLEPNNVQALTGLAQVSLSRNAPGESEKLLLQAAQASPAVGPRLLLAQLYIAQTRLPAAAEQLRLAGEAAPDDPEVAAVKGLLALSEGRATEAIELLTKAQAKLPQRLGVVLALAAAHVRAGQIEKARGVLQAVLQQAPQSLPVRMALGTVDLRSGNSDEATKIAKALQTEFPQQRHGYVLEAQVDVARRRYDEAVAVLRVAYRQEPTWQVLKDLVFTTELAGRANDAVELLEGWVAKRPNDVEAQLTLASALQAAQQPDRALTHYQAVLKTDEQNVVALNNAAWLYQGMADPRALGLAERALSRAPDNAAVLDTLGTILLKQNREADAIGHLEKAAQLAPKTLETRYHLAQAQAALGRKAEARATLQTVLADTQPFTERAAAQALFDKL